MNKKAIKTSNSRYKHVWRLALYGFLLGLIFPFIAILYFAANSSLSFSLQSIYELHTIQPILFLIDSVPLFCAFLTLVFFLLRENEHNKLYKKFLAQEKQIHQYAGYVKSIGDGNYSETENLLFQDELGLAISVMNKNLKSKSRNEEKQKWIFDTKNMFDTLLVQHTEIQPLAHDILHNLIIYSGAVQGIFYIFDDEVQKLVPASAYAYGREKYFQKEYELGEGLIGQAAYEKGIVFRKNLPDDFFRITSGILGEQKPKAIIVIPLLGDEKIQGVIEFAFLKNEIADNIFSLFKELGGIIGQTIFNIKANTTTRKLLSDSQKLTDELRKNEGELRKNATQMELTQVQLEKSNLELAQKISEVEQGQKRLYSLLENASEIITIYDEKGIVQYVSPSVKSILGFEPKEMLGLNRFDRGEKLLKDMFQALLEKPDEEKNFEYQYFNKNNVRLWLETTGRNLLNNPAINGILFNTRDITERKEAENIKRLNSEMQSLSENSPDMIVRMGLNGDFFYANPTTETFIGLKPELLIGNNIDNIDLNKNTGDFFKNLANDVRIEQKEIQKETILLLEEQQRIVQFNAIPEYSDKDQLNTILFVVHDITEQKEIEIEIENKNKNITESINYAQRIQAAIVPDLRIMKRYLPNSFVLYRPRDVVSGDLPWFHITDEEIYLAVIDCTGHGVPGALISFIAYFSLNSIISQDKRKTAAEILDELHLVVKRTLRQDSSDAKTRDGMDIALLKINYKTNKMEFAGAHRPLLLLRNGKLKRYRGDRMSIGGQSLRAKRSDKEEKFTNYKIDIEKKDKIFIFTDGIPDQIGGENARKYQAGRVRDIIVEKNNFSMKEYYDYFVEDFGNWMRGYKQIDDILFMGIEF